MKIQIHTDDADPYPIDMGKILGQYRKKIKKSMYGVQVFGDKEWQESEHPRGQPGNAGQFASSSGGGSTSNKSEPKETVSFVSPNEDPNNLSFEQAHEGLRSKRQKILAGISHKIDSDLGISDIRVNDVIGAWSDGAENSVMTNSASTDPDIEEVAAVMKGFLANQKAILLFHPDDAGHQFMAQFRVNSNDLGDIHQRLLKSNIHFHTLEPRGNDTVVHFYGDAEEDLHQFSEAAKQFDQKVQVFRGHGKFIPPDIEGETDEEQRNNSRQAYIQTIRRVADTGKLPSDFESKWQNHIDNWIRETGERIGEHNYEPAGWQPEPTESRPTAVKIQEEDGSIRHYELPSDVVEHARQLKEDADKYFKTETEGTEFIPVDKLVQRRARPEGVAHAVELMAKAYTGEGGKRGPIHVQKLEDGHYLVLDGNSTTTIATAAGWSHLPAIVIPDESYLPKKPPKPTKDRRWRDILIHTFDGIFRLSLRDAAEFIESEHPRGQPNNAGQFVKGGGATAAAKTKQQQAHTPSRRGKREAGEREEAEWKVQARQQAKEDPAAKVNQETTGSTRLNNSEGHPGLIGTALPKGKDADFNKPSLALAKTDPKKFKQQIQVFKENISAYPLNDDEVEGDDDTVARHIIDHIKSNLKFIYNQTPEDQRKRSKEWYVGARRLVDEHVENYKEYGLKDTTAAGVYAVLSPNNLWDQNVRQGDRMLDIYLKHRKDPWDDKMTDAVNNTKNPTVKEAMQQIQNKKYDDLDTPEKKALWIRIYDEGHAVDNPEYKELGFQPFHKITPEGKREGWYTKPVNVHEYRAFAWTSGTLMGKAIRIMESDGDPKVIDNALRDDEGAPPQHKVRSFYNNILDPHSKNEDVTMDTHAVDAAWLMDDPIAVAHNFGDIPQLKGRPTRWISGTPASVKTGMTGNYFMNAEAYREAAHDLGLEPRELQSIVWETKRKWMETMTADNHRRMRDTWEDYRLGLLTQEEAQNKVKSIIDEDLSISSEEKRRRSKALGQAKRNAKKNKPQQEEEDG